MAKTASKAEASTLEISPHEDRLIHALGLLGDRTRYKIFKLILQKEQLCVSDIAHELGVTVSAVSQHFRSFELVGLVGKHRTGQKICYVVNREDKLVDDLVKFVFKVS